MHGCQANKEATCGLPAVLGLCPKRKYHPLCGWMLIVLRKNINKFFINTRTVFRTEVSLMRVIMLSLGFRNELPNYMLYFLEFVH